MYQQYVNQIQTSISSLSSEELKELLNNDDELERRVDEVVCIFFVSVTSFVDDSFHKILFFPVIIFGE